MKKSFSVHLLTLFSLLVTGPILGRDGHVRTPQLSPAGLKFPANAVGLSQTDFADGPYRIQAPGYYYLTEDVAFNPATPTVGSDGIDGGRTTDRPRTGAWFAAISVESDNVTIDLNSYTLECAQAFIDNHEFKVFAMIELGNSPFPHNVFAYSDVGPNDLFFPKTVTIKNGTLGRNNHHCIHGNRNRNIRIHDVICKDWEVAGIALNGLQSGEIRSVTISGVEHQIKFTGFLSLINSALVELRELVDDGDTNAQPYLTALENFKANLSVPPHPEGMHDGNCYGLFLNRAVDVGPMPTEHCTDGTTNCIMIEDVEVSNIKAQIIETVGVIETASGKLLKGIPFGVMRWVDLFDGGGNFAPNAVIKAQAYVVQQVAHPFPGNEPNDLSILSDILSGNPAVLNKIHPAFNMDFAGHTNKGVFGIRVDCGHGVNINNCFIVGVENIGSKGAQASDLPGGSNYTNLARTRYTGNDTFGVSVAVCHNSTVANTKAFECYSANGHVFGFNIKSHAEVNAFENCVSSDHYAGNDAPGSLVNPPSQVYGFLVDGTANSNTFINCESTSLTAPREVCGFWVAGAADNVFEGCRALSNVATSGTSLSTTKYAVGFKSLGASCTRFSDCEAVGMQCTGETSAGAASVSTAAGFLLESQGNTDDSYAVVENCRARCSNGGAGKGAGILLSGAHEATISSNVATDNRADNATHGLGYGIIDGAANTASLFTKNLAYGNKTCNYSVNFTEANQTLPLATALYGNFGNLHMANAWINVSLERTPVKYDGENTNTTILVRQTINN